MEGIDKSFFILGNPIDTKIGKIRFLKVPEYPTLVEYVPYLQLQRFEIMRLIREKLGNDYLNMCRKDNLFTLIIRLRNKFNFYNKFRELFQLCFDDDVIDKINTNEEFEYYKDLIMEMNVIKKEDKNPNPEIQMYIDYKKKLNEARGGNVDFESIYTSIEIFTGLNPLDMTIYKFFMSFYRIGQFKKYDAGILYSTIDTSFNVEEWFNIIELNKEEEVETYNSLEELQGTQRTL